MKTKKTQKIKILGIGTIGLLVALAMAPQILADTTGTTPLIMAQTENIGDITLQQYESADGGDILEITFDLTNLTWALNETHVDVQLDPGDFPMAKKGNPKVGHFAYQNDSHLAGETSYTYTLSGDWENVTLYIAAHAEVSTLVTEVINETTGETITYYVYESAWGDGTDFPGRNWAMYFTLEL